jgi:hypothetical protein
MCSKTPIVYPSLSISDATDVWVCLYYIVSWLCTHHAICHLVVERSKVSITPGHSHQDDVDPASSCCSCLLEALCSAKHFVTSVTSSRGKYNVIYRVLREVAENTVQLAGVFSTARTRDVDAVAARTLLLSLNFIVLPVVALWTFVVWGPDIAKMNVLVWETMFDRAFIALGVVLQLTSSSANVRDVDLGEQIMEHVPSLMPALFYCAFPRTALMVSSPGFLSKCFDVGVEDAIAHALSCHVLYSHTVHTTHTCRVSLLLQIEKPCLNRQRRQSDCNTKLPARYSACSGAGNYVAHTPSQFGAGTSSCDFPEPGAVPNLLRRTGVG